MDSLPDPATYLSHWLKVDRKLATKLALWLESKTEEELMALVRT
jgi:hypothetical protein